MSATTEVTRTSRPRSGRGSELHDAGRTISSKRVDFKPTSKVWVGPGLLVQPSSSATEKPWTDEAEATVVWKIGSVVVQGNLNCVKGQREKVTEASSPSARRTGWLSKGNGQRPGLRETWRAAELGLAEGSAGALREKWDLAPAGPLASGLWARALAVRADGRDRRSSIAGFRHDKGSAGQRSPIARQYGGWTEPRTTGPDEYVQLVVNSTKERVTLTPRLQTQKGRGLAVWLASYAQDPSTRRQSERDFVTLKNFDQRLTWLSKDRGLEGTSAERACTSTSTSNSILHFDCPAPKSFSYKSAAATGYEYMLAPISILQPRFL
ncbi:hypothetical protein EV356DRAFT_548427 [Viridothelium virens]|uniref:Uncharacterized protein n=1 Tax=Viridothelium virens TaxID=1048519 RepID=A0A6A6HLX0_VIRVR|nr:hypothetical protein EV356DRAFT_548427 [Viridothelium virens]